MEQFSVLTCRPYPQHLLPTWKYSYNYSLFIMHSDWYFNALLLKNEMPAIISNVIVQCIFVAVGNKRFLILEYSCTEQMSTIVAYGGKIMNWCMKSRDQHKTAKSRATINRIPNEAGVKISTTYTMMVGSTQEGVFWCCQHRIYNNCYYNVNPVRVKLFPGQPDKFTLKY